ncbi:MAG: S8 family serine peptidase, partial [Bacteroidetes bacterium]|nr:S8 family serine peptidase [Bacteroidota bacterium]
WYDANGSDVTAYIIDTGIRYTHDDFKDANNNSRASPGFDAFGGTGSDGNGHGTHVAGTVGGTFWGVAKNVNLVSVRVLDNNGGGTISTVVAGVDYVAGQTTRPAVANMSLGGGASTTLDNAVANAVSKGVTFVVSAGNSNRDACRYSPAREPSAITVGATTSSDSRASYSNYGSCVDIFAPGSDITSAHNSSDNATAVFSGTSMSAPHVAGVAALFLESNSTASPGQVMNAILGSGTQGVLVGNLGRGSPNLLLYSLFSGTPPTGGLSAPSGLSASVVSQTQIDVSWNSVSNASEYEIRIRDINNNTSTVQTTLTSHSWTGLSASSTYSFSVRAGDGSNWSSWSGEISATTMDNPPATPTGFGATTVSASQINTGWNSVSNASEYEVRIRDGNSNTSTVSTTSTSHSWTGLSASTTYYFRVRAGNSGGWSAWSSEVSATTDDAPQSVTAYITAATGSSASVNPANWAATLTVEVRDAQSGGNPVPGATVTITWSGDASGSATAVTNSSGIASVTTDNLHVRKVSSVSMTVSDVTGTNITYGGPASAGLLPVIVNQ